MPCDAPGEDADVGDEDPCLGAGDGFLPVLGEPSASAEPGKGAFDHPAARQEFEALGDVGALDDLQFPVADAGQCRSEEHTSELQSRENLVCRLLLEKKKHTSKANA